jgi:hypothetical protein
MGRPLVVVSECSEGVTASMLRPWHNQPALACGITKTFCKEHWYLQAGILITHRVSSSLEWSIWGDFPYEGETNPMHWALVGNHWDQQLHCTVEEIETGENDLRKAALSV